MEFNVNHITSTFNVLFKVYILTMFVEDAKKTDRIKIK